MMKKVALYCRVSTDQQSTGLEAQARALKLYCEQNGIINYELFTDENVSGTKSSRPALDRMMSAAKAGEVSAVIVWSFSRFARSTTHLLSALETFRKLEISFISLTEKLDTRSPLGLAIFTILGAIAQLERDLIAERVRNGLANAKAKGKHIGRIKQRDSDLIRKLLKAGLTFRAIATIAKCSHGSVWAEKQELLKEKRAEEVRLEEERATSERESAEYSVFPDLDTTCDGKFETPAIRKEAGN